MEACNRFRLQMGDFYEYLSTTNAMRVFIVTFILIPAVGFSVGFGVAANKAAKAAEEDETRRAELFKLWERDITMMITRAETMASAAGSFGAGTAYTPANFSATAAERLNRVNPAGWKTLCQDLTDLLPGIHSVALVTGGVTSLACPEESAPPGFDLMSNTRYRRMLNQVMRDGAPVVLGPTTMESVPNGAAIHSWFPIFINGTTSPRNRTTFWGAGWVVVELNTLLTTIKMDSVLLEHGLDYVVYYTDATGDTLQTTIVRTTTDLEGPANEHYAGGGAGKLTPIDIIRLGTVLKLPVGEDGLDTCLAMYPRDGPVSGSISTRDIIVVVLTVVLGTIALAIIVALCLYGQFGLRHRFAPANEGAAMVGIAVSLRGAQPIVDKAPLEAVKMFEAFIRDVRRRAAAHGCYAVCEIGDRTVYLASMTAEAAMRFATEVASETRFTPSSVLDAASVPNTATAMSKHSRRGRGGNATNPSTTAAPAVSTTVMIDGRSASYRSGQPSTTADETHSHDSTSDGGSISSFTSAVVCHASVALHCFATRLDYSAQNDRYFFGLPSNISRLCTAVDGTKGGEVGWTQAYEEDHYDLCKATMRAAISSHAISEGGNEPTLTVASFVRETGNERDNEDPSVAMAAIRDAYVKKMTTVMSQGRNALRDKSRKKQAGGGDTTNGSNQSAEATAVTRNATILHIAILATGEGAHRMPIETVRRVVAEEKGAVVSAQGAVFTAAFNLLTAGGHHQVRAANCVMRLRSLLSEASCLFVCSIHCGRVDALIADGIVLCSGEVVDTGRALLEQAASCYLNLSGGQAPSRQTATPIIPFDTSDEETFDLHATATLDNLSSGQSDSGRLKSKGVITSFRGGLRRQNTNSYSIKSKSRDAELARAVRDDDPLCGLCLIFAHDELSTVFECEALDIVSAMNPLKGAASPLLFCQRRVADPPMDLVASSASPAKTSALRILYRLAFRKVDRTNDDEWMYRLKDEEDRSPFSTANTIFKHIVDGDIDLAAGMYKKLLADAKKEKEKESRRRLDAVIDSSDNDNGTTTRVLTNNTATKTTVVDGEGESPLTAEIHAVLARILRAHGAQ